VLLLLLLLLLLVLRSMHHWQRAPGELQAALQECSSCWASFPPLGLMLSWWILMRTLPCWECSWRKTKILRLLPQQQQQQQHA
jgi:hypothetical protein